MCRDETAPADRSFTGSPSVISCRQEGKNRVHLSYVDKEAMRQELDDLLCQRYPELFRDRHGDRAETGMCWGFACGDGWFGIIDGLCAELSNQVRVGRMPAVVVSQVKEKSGHLRFGIRGGFLRGGNAETHRLIELAQQQALHTCEECGQPGELLDGGKSVVLCPACANQDLNKEASR